MCFVVIKLKMIWLLRDQLRVFNAIINSSNILSGSQKQIIVGPYPEFFILGGGRGGGGRIVTKKDQKAVWKKLYLLETNSEERNT